MKTLQVENLGPIRKANIEFGDLTVLVGPQASGKSLFVQTYKAMEDAKAIRKELRNYGFDWQKSATPVEAFCESYYGGGMRKIASDQTKLVADGRQRTFKSIALPQGNGTDVESVYLIPAQRVLMLQDGWPRPFMSYPVSDPYSIKRFSEVVRLLMEGGLGQAGILFPQPKRLKQALKEQLAESIYQNGTLNLETEGARKRIVLTQKDKTTLASGAWSAGQREFTPLLLGLYWLMPASKLSKRDEVQTVIIEEPEMGLHPRAIITFGLLLLELLHRNYRVIVSTHAPTLLDLVWALGELKEAKHDAALHALKDVFQVSRLSGPLKEVFEAALQKTYKTYYFDRTDHGIETRDISSLNPGDDDPNVAGWGGLSGFSGQIADSVGKALA